MINKITWKIGRFVINGYLNKVPVAELIPVYSTSGQIEEVVLNFHLLFKEPGINISRFIVKSVEEGKERGEVLLREWLRESGLGGGGVGGLRACSKDEFNKLIGERWRIT